MNQETAISSDLFKVLSNKNFLKLWLSQVASQVTTHMINFTLILKIYQITGSSLAVSLVILAFYIPSIIFSLFGGVYVDRFSRKQILVWTNFLQAIIVLTYLLAGGNILLILLILFIYSLINQFFFPAEGAMIPQLVREKEILAANSLYIFTFFITFMIGYGLAGPVIKLFGDLAPFYFGSAMLALAFLSVASLPSDSLGASKFKNKNEIYKNVFSDLKECWNFIKKHRVVIPSLTNFTLSQLVIGILAVLAPAIASEISKIDVRSTSLFLLFPAALGMMGGIFFLGINSRRFSQSSSQKKLAQDGLYLAGLALICVAYSGKIVHFLSSVGFNLNLLFFLMALTALGGFGGAMIIVPSRSLLYQNTPSFLQGRILGVLSLLVTSSFIFSVFIAGILADFLSVTTSLASLGFALIFYNFFLKSKISSE